jgi:alanine dehydrogenase
MIVGVPKETKTYEYRVGLTPQSVRELVDRGHTVLVESGAGTGIGLPDGEYERAGARVVGDAAAVFDASEMIVKVKEPQAAERKRLKPGQVLFTYLHLAPDPEQTKELVASGSICIAYETVTGAGGSLPLLAPMSEVAGRMSVQAGATALQKSSGGRGILLGGVPGASPGRVVILGGGVVGTNAAFIATGMGADVYVIDRSLDALRRLSSQFGSRIRTLFSTRDAVEAEVAAADLVIGGVLVPGATAPRMVTRAMLGQMKPGAVLVDVSIDQGGCFETSRPTTHASPTYEVQGIIHYCVANMPGAVARTSTFALNNATLPHVVALAAKGWRHALREDAHLRNGLNVAQGRVTNLAVANELGYDFRPAEEVALA